MNKSRKKIIASLLLISSFSIITLSINKVSIVNNGESLIEFSQPTGRSTILNLAKKQEKNKNDVMAKIQSNQDINNFMLIPDAAWGPNDHFLTNPDSPLKDLLADGDKSIILFERAMVRPFILQKSVNNEELEAARKKYKFIDTQTLIFNKDNIGDVFITKQFKNKYNETSAKPWWTWTFAELVLEEKKFSIDKNPQATEVVIKNYYQEEWFKNFVANNQLKTKTLADFFPQKNEGYVAVVGSYRPNIATTGITLKESSGFWFAGEQRDDFNQIKNYNYVVELEVKNKIYDSRLSELELTKQENESILNYNQFAKLMQSLTEELKQYFTIDTTRFKKDQIKDPILTYISNQNNKPFEPAGYGQIVISYQNFLPVVSQIGNEEVIEELPFNLNNLIGMDDFRNKYAQYIIDDLAVYEKLNDEEKESKILIDNDKNQFILGGKAIAKMQKITLNGMESKVPVVITNEYIDPSITVFGFDSKTKKRETFAEFQKRWAIYSQKELFNLLFTKVNTSENLKFLEDTIKQRNVVFKVIVSPEGLKVTYTYQDLVDQNKIWTDDFNSPLPLNEIRAIRMDLLDKNSFFYGYDRDKDTNLSFEGLIKKIKDVNQLVNHFNFIDDFEKESFLKGINTINVEANASTETIKITLTLNRNFVVYDEKDNLTFIVNPKQMKKVDLGNFELKNINRKIKEEIVNKSSEEMLNYLNLLNLDIKKTFFASENKIFLSNNVVVADNFDNQISDIVFTMENDALIANVKFNDDTLVLARSSKTKIDNFVYNLKVELGIINPFLDQWMPLIIGLTTGFLTVGFSLLIWFLVKRHKQKQAAK